MAPPPKGYGPIGRIGGEGRGEKERIGRNEGLDPNENKGGGTKGVKMTSSSWSQSKLSS